MGMQHFAQGMMQNVMNKICAISLLSYDYEFLLKTLPAYLNQVDVVILGLDRQRLTWSGNKFEIPESFFERLQSLDTEQKIKIVEDNFFVEGSNPRDLDTRERNILSTHAPAGSWLLSVDADELLLNADDLTAFLRDFTDENVCLFGNWITLFKQSGKSMFVIENEPETLERFPLATMKSNIFNYCRNTPQRIVFTSACAIHYSWARTREELERKLLNWTHRDDFKVDEFMQKWDSLNESTYEQFVDFHPFDGPMWQKLALVDEERLDEYARLKGHEFNLYQAWKSVPVQARLGLLEEKIIARDAATAALKSELEEKLHSLSLQLAQSKKESEQLTRRPGLFAGLFRNKE
jgi:hypothetical protein